MQQHAKEWTIEEMAQLLGVSRSGYYRYCKHKPSQRQQENAMLISKLNRFMQQVVKPMAVHASMLSWWHKVILVADPEWQD